MNFEAILFVLAGALGFVDSRLGFAMILVVGVLRLVH